MSDNETNAAGKGAKIGVVESDARDKSVRCDPLQDKAPQVR